MPKIDRLLYQASTEWFMTRLLGYQHKFMPLYMSGKNDILVELESLGPLDSVNYNVMLRKCFQLNIQHKWLIQTYTMIPTTIQLSLFCFRIHNSIINTSWCISLQIKHL